MGSTTDSVWKVNVVGANITIKEPQNPNDTVIFINGAPQSNNTECVSGSTKKRPMEYVWMLKKSKAYSSTCGYREYESK